MLTQKKEGLMKVLVRCLCSGLLTFGLISPVSAAVIAVNGDISSNTIWTANNIYNVTAYTRLLGGVTLTIEPGTVIKVDDGVGLEINGQLVAQGTAQNKIWFTSNSSTPASGSWDKILFQNLTPTDNSHQSLIEHIVVEYSTLGLYQTLTGFDITNSTFRHNGYGVIVASTPAVITSRVQDNHFKGNSLAGIGLFGSATFPPQASIENNHFYDQLSYNIYAIPTAAPTDMSALTINADGNWWGSNDVTTINALIWDNSDNPDSLVINISNTRLSGTARSGAIAVTETWTTANDPYVVTGNLDIQTTGTLTIEAGVTVQVLNNGLAEPFSILNSGQLTVAGTLGQDVLFTSVSMDTPGTQNVGDWQALQLNPGSGATLQNFVLEYATLGLIQDGVSADVTQATFNNNVIGLLLRGGASPTISQSVIRDNLQAGILISGSQSVPSLPTINDNDFSNNGSAHLQLETTAGDLSSVTIDAERNWWEATDPVVIDGSIYDDDEDALLPTVDFTPYLDMAGGLPIGEGPTTVPAGTINTATTWTRLNSPYVVTGDVVVDSLASLTIEPGVVVKFDGYYEIQGDGLIQAVGTPERRITFTSNQTTPAMSDWHRIRFSKVNSILDFTDVEYAHHGIVVASYTPSPVTIQNSDFQYNHYGIYQESGSGPDIIRNNLNNNYRNLYLGCNVYSGCSPTIKYNNILGSSNIDVWVEHNGSNASGNIIDAEYNWWGTTDLNVIENEITHQADYWERPLVLFEPVLTVPQEQFLAVTKNDASPHIIDISRSETTTIQYELDFAATVNVTIKDEPTGNVVRQLVNAQLQPAGPHSAVWDGLDDASQPVPDGHYLYVIDASTTDGKQGGYDPVFDPQAEVNVSNLIITPVNNFKPVTGQRLEIQYDLSQPALVTMLYGQIPFIIDELRDTNSNIDIWDGRDSVGSLMINTIVSNGFSLVNISVQTQPLAENLIVVKSKVLLDIIDLTIEPYVIRPLFGDATSINYTINEAADVTVEVLSPDGQETIATLLPQTSQSFGSPPDLVWDGRDDQGHVVDVEGNYQIKITAIDSNNQVVNRIGNVRVMP